MTGLSDNLTSMRQVTATEAARRFSEVLDAVEHRGETFLVTRGGRQVARLVPVTAANGRAVKDLLRKHRPDGAWSDELRALRELLTVREPTWPD